MNTETDNPVEQEPETGYHSESDTDLEQAQVPWDKKIGEDFHIVVYEDGFPVSKNHLLFVPKYNTPEVIRDCFYDALKAGMTMMERGACDGFNIGMNMGAAAGQTVMYPHVHLIPRYKGDVPDPRGGVRNVIPSKGNYLK